MRLAWRCTRSISRQLPLPKCKICVRRASADRGGVVRRLNAATDSGRWSDDSKAAQDSESLNGLEKAIQDIVISNEPPRGDWEEIAGCWVLRPPSGAKPEAVAHFLGGAFIGAAPQLAYKDFLEAMAVRKVLIVATPYSTSFDHLRTADEAQFKFDSVMRELGPYGEDLPIYGVGHSLGALIHLLISSRYAVQRAGNVLMSFNNKPATEVVPFLAQISPSAAVLGPIMSQIAASPLRSTAEMMQEALKGISPSIIRQISPIMEQFAPIYLEVTQGRKEFTPSNEDTRERIRAYYGVARNLLMKFNDDTLDESDALGAMLQASGIASILDMTTRTLPGDHMRPMQKRLVDLPPEFNEVANQALTRGGDLLGRLSEMAVNAGQLEPSDRLRKVSEGVSGMAALFDQREPDSDQIEILVDEIAVWMGVGGVMAKGPKLLRTGDS